VQLQSSNPEVKNLWSAFRDNHAQQKLKEQEKIEREERLRQERLVLEEQRKQEEINRRKAAEEARLQRIKAEEEARQQREKEIEEARLRAKMEREQKLKAEEDDEISFDAGKFEMGSMGGSMMRNSQFLGMMQNLKSPDLGRVKKCKITKKQKNHKNWNCLSAFHFTTLKKR